MEELLEVINDDFTSVQEYQLMDFLLQWANQNKFLAVEQLRTVIECVRFTKMSEHEFFDAVERNELKQLFGWKRSRDFLELQSLWDYYHYLGKVFYARR